MPIFEYICQACNHRFETLVLGKQAPACPRCHGRRLAPQLSVFSVAAKGSANVRPGAAPCGTCGDPRGQGACSLPELD